MQAHSDCLTSRAAATTLARARIIFLLLPVVRYGAGVARVALIDWLAPAG